MDVAVLAQLKQTYARLCAPPDNASAAWFRQRGFEFERLLAELLRADNLEPRTSYKPAGEQIDGSLFLDGTVLLLEAKWQKDEIPASTLYQFKGKVDGKLVGTLGVFLSMSGYSTDAVDALTLGKSLNMVLFDKRDIDAAINKGLGFRSILKRKLRHAAEVGVVYFPTEVEIVTGKDSTLVEIEKLGYDTATGSVFSQQLPTAGSADQLFVVCEGSTDREVIARLAKRILASTNSLRSIKIVVAMGKYTIPRVANAMQAHVASGSQILIVVDGDNEQSKTLEMLQKNISFDKWIAAIPNPAIETWLGIDEGVSRKQTLERRVQIMLDAAQSIDIEQLRQRDQSFEVFYSTLTK